MLSETQKGLLELLKEIDDICTRHDIDFYLAGGSMIGAVRHAGFLPWDDDADIHMTKEGVEKFISLQDEFLPGRIVVSKNTNEDYSAVHWRYMNTNMTTMLRSGFFTEAPQGQFIDIFILNPIPSDESRHPAILSKYLLYSEWVVNHFSTSSVREDSFFDGYEELRKREKEEGFDKVRRELENELFEYPDEVCDYYLIRSPCAGKPIFHKSFWGKPRRIPFEDCMMPVAEKAEEVLLQSYGDRWIDIPEMVDQISHVFVSDQEIPYAVYDKDVRDLADKKTMLDFAYHKKDTWYAHAKDRNLSNSMGREATKYPILAMIRKRLAKTNLNQLIREKQYDKLRSIFRDYYKAQFADFKYYGLYFDMPEQYLYGALLPLAMQGAYSKAGKVLNMREAKIGLPANPKLKELYDFCHDATDMTNNIYVYKDYQKAWEPILKWLPVFPDCRTLLRAEVFLLLQKEEPDIDLIRGKIINTLRLYPEDGEMIKYLGDTYKMQGDLEMTAKLYRRALGTITNGLLMTEMKKYLENLDNA